MKNPGKDATMTATKITTQAHGTGAFTIWGGSGAYAVVTGQIYTQSVYIKPVGAFPIAGMSMNSGSSTIQTWDLEMTDTLLLHGFLDTKDWVHQKA